MSPFDRAQYEFLIDINRNDATIFYRFRVIASSLSKVAN